MSGCLAQKTVFPLCTGKRNFQLTDLFWCSVRKIPNGNPLKTFGLRETYLAYCILNQKIKVRMGITQFTMKTETKVWTFRPHIQRWSKYPDFCICFSLSKKWTCSHLNVHLFVIERHYGLGKKIPKLRRKCILKCMKFPVNIIPMNIWIFSHRKGMYLLSGYVQSQELVFIDREISKIASPNEVFLEISWILKAKIQEKWPFVFLRI